MRRVYHAAMLGMLLLGLACADPAADDTAPAGDPPDTATRADACDAAPTVTWATFGEGFLTGSCQPCHASTAPNRYGAPEDVVFDTVTDAWAHADGIVGRAGAEPPTMPPMGGTDSDDRQRLRWWLSCGEKGT